MPGLETPMDLERYLPFYWTAISNRWTAASSRIYLERFGLGVVEWRVLATLAALGSATSLDAARLAELDSGAASRAMHKLYRGELVTPVVGKFVGRSKPFEMTQAGISMFENVSAVASERARLLLQDLSPDEQLLLLDLLRRVHARLPDLVRS